MAYDFGANNNTDFVNMNDGTVKTRQDLLNDPNTTKIDTTQNGLSNSFNKLGYQLKAQGNALGSFVTGDKSMMDNAIYNQQIAQGLSKPTDDITNVHSLSDFGNWATDVAVQNASMLIPGGIIGKGVQLGAEKVASGLLKQSISASMRDAMFKAGLGATMGVQNVAQQNLTNINNYGQNMSAGQGALSFGAGAGLGVVEGNALLGLKNRSGLIANMAQTGATAGGINVAQSAVNRGILGQDLASKEAINEYLNAGAGGALFGAPFGAFNRARPEGNINPSNGSDSASNARPVDLNGGDGNALIPYQEKPLTTMDNSNGENFRGIPGTERDAIIGNDGSIAQSFDINNPVDPAFQIDGQRRLPYEDNGNKSNTESITSKYKNNDLNLLSNHIDDSISNVNETPRLNYTPESNVKPFEFTKETYDNLLQGFKNKRIETEFKNTTDSILGENPSENKIKLLESVKENLNKEGTTVFDNISFLRDLQEKAPKIDDNVAHSINDKINPPKEIINDGFENTPIQKDGSAKIQEYSKDGSVYKKSDFGDGDIEYSKDGYKHNDNGPAVIKNDGRKEWYQNGKLHNENGPAIIHSNGSETYFLNGNKLKKEEYNKIVNGEKSGSKDNLINNFNEGKINNQNDFNSIFDNIRPERKPNFDNPVKQFTDKDGNVYTKRENSDGSVDYFKNDQEHNDFGPSSISEEDGNSYALDGKYLNKEQFEKITKYGLKDNINSNMSKSDIDNLISKAELNNKLNENLPEKGISDAQARANDISNSEKSSISESQKFDNGSSFVNKDGTTIHTFEENGSVFKRATFEDGVQQFYKDGLLHREVKDGPAVDWGDKINNEYWVNGKEVKVGFNKDGIAFVKKDNATASGKTKLSEDGNFARERIREELPQDIYDRVAQSIDRNDTQSAVNTMKDYFDISKEKQAIIDKANRGFDTIRKMVNVGIEVIAPEHSPYYDGANAWFDPVNNKIFIVNSEANKGNLSSLLRHELFHKGIQNIVSKEGLQSYYDAMDRLYNNRRVREITEKLQNENPDLRNDKYTAVEEALARLIENGEFDKMPIYKQVIDFFKKFLNKITGNNEFVSDRDVKAFLDKTEKAVFESPEQQAQYLNSVMDTVKFSVRGLSDPVVEKAILETNNDPVSEGFAQQLDNVWQKGIWNSLRDKINSDDPWSAMNNSTLGKWTKKFFNTSIANYIMTKDALLRATGPIGSKIVDIQDLKNTLEGNAKAGLNGISQKAMELSKLISKNDKDKINQILDTYAYHREKDANGKIIEGNKGVRLDRNTLERELQAKGFAGDRLKKAMDLANETRRMSDFGIYQDALNDSILRVETFKNMLREFDPDISYKINDLIDKTVRSEFPFDSNNPDPSTYINLKNFNENLKNIIGQDTLNKMASSNQENFNFVTKTLGEIDGLYGKAGTLMNNGYIHRDFSGRYVVRMTTQYMQKNGKIVEKTVGVFAHDDKTTLLKKIDQMEKEFQNAGIEIGEGKKYNFTYDERPNGDFTSIDTQKALLQLASEGVTISDKDLKTLSIAQKIGDDFAREFKGYGENQNIQEVAYNYALKKVRDTSNNYMTADVNHLMNSLAPNSPQRTRIHNIMNDIQKNINHKNSNLVEKWKGFASFMALGFSIPNNVAQLFQTAQIRQSIFEKYGQSAYDYTNSFANNKKAFSYISYGSNEIKKTGMKEFDDFIERNKNNELFGSSLNKELFAMSDGFDRNAWSDITNKEARARVVEDKGYSGLTKEALSLVKEEAYNLNGYFERSLRLTTAMQAFDIYQSYKEGKITDPKVLEQFKIGGKEKSLDQFIFENLRSVNGDFSKPNRSGIFNSDLGQILFQFQQWKPLTINAFTQMSDKGKIAFALTNAFAFGGMSGIPFSDDLMNITDELLKMFGAEPFFKNKIEKMSKAIRGDNPNAMTEMMSAYVKHGLPLIGDRVGLGSFTPFVKGLTELPDDTNKGIKDLIGPSTNTITGLAQGATQIAKGNIGQGLITASPTALKNLAKGASAMVNGEVTSADGVTKMYDTNFITASAISLGFKTPDILNENDRNMAISEYKKYRMQERSNIQNDYIKAFRNKDYSAMNTLRNEAIKEQFDINFGTVISNSTKTENKNMSENAISKLSSKEQQRIKNILG